MGHGDHWGCLSDDVKGIIVETLAKSFDATLRLALRWRK
jgi:hypothetical protein